MGARRRRGLLRLEGRVLAPEGPRGVALVIEGERLVALRDVARAPERLLLPGFVDLHVHGGGGHDAMDGEAGVLGLAAFHARHGTTALCPTTVTETEERLVPVLRGVGAAACAPAAGRGRVLGAHLEGPFISPSRLGAQPAKAAPADAALLARLLEAGPVVTVTLAPELDRARALVELCRARGVRASLGHTGATCDEARAAFGWGASGATHLFNAMTGLDHRSPGVAAAALEEEGATLELILDGHHVHEALFRIALRSARGRLALVTDAIRAAGLGDGETELGGRRVLVNGGRATLAEGGALAGSVLTLDRALANAVARGVPLARAVALVSENPARALGREDLGRLVPGALADVVELDPGDLSVKRVFVGGREVDRAS